MVIAEATRDITLDTAFNVRHIGGYPTRHGGHTSRHLIRAASLHRLTEAGISSLREAGVRTVVDLRSQVERQDMATPDLSGAGIAHVVAAVFEQDASPVGLEAEFPGFAQVYQRFLDTGAPAYRVLFETIAATEGGLLFHCAAGKDRTGVAAALLLEVAGVEHRHIVADFSRSAELLKPQLALWRGRMAERGIDEARAAALMASNAEDMAATLGYIGEQWGGAGGYLAGIGVTSLVLERVRKRMTA
ncbi:MAG: tyrosine-protein phosphatase [Chloroflexi bacterium]|nr:tyrosine-protein phosphatase [Chloroflexota bacterium]